MFWWPKLEIPKGWHQDKEQSYHYGSKALAPDGYTFANAESVIYARAQYKPRIPNIKPLDQFIEDDKKNILESSSGIEIKEVNSLATADGTQLRSLSFIPENNGNWEHVSYAEEGDFYLIFTLSSRSQRDYEKSIATYESIIRNYKGK
ncbi:MAG: hypothetical protein QM744_05385 [Mesorhizobium sp.]